MSKTKKYVMDISNYTGDVSVDQFRFLKDKGWDGAMIRLSIENGTISNLAQRQLQNAHSAGLVTSGYSWAKWGQDPYHVGDLTMQIAVTAGVPLSRVWLDMEDDPGYTNITEWAKQWRKGIGLDQKAGIYTAKWWWDRWGNDKIKALQLPLLLAQYDGVQDFNKVTLFGPWTRAAGKQYSNFMDDPLRYILSDVEVMRPGYE